MLSTSRRVLRVALRATALALIVSGGYAGGAASAHAVTVTAADHGGDSPRLTRLLDNGTPSRIGWCRYGTVVARVVP